MTRCAGAAPGAAPYADRASCLYVWIEDNAIPRPLCGGGFCGLFPMVATALLGMFAGDWLRSGLMSLFPAGWDAFVGEAGYVVVYWLLLYLMYRKGIFLRA